MAVQSQPAHYRAQQQWPAEYPRPTPPPTYSREQWEYGPGRRLSSGEKYAWMSGPLGWYLLIFGGLWAVRLALRFLW